MHRTLRRYVGRTVVISIDGEPLRGTLTVVDRGAVIVANAEQADGTRIDGVVVIPLPCIVQVV